MGDICLLWSHRLVLKCYITEITAGEEEELVGFALMTGTQKGKGRLKSCRICMADHKKNSSCSPSHSWTRCKAQEAWTFSVWSNKKKTELKLIISVHPNSPILLIIIAAQPVVSFLDNTSHSSFLPATWQLTCFAPFLPRPSPMSPFYAVLVKYVCHSNFLFITVIITSRVHRCAVLLGGSLRFLLNLWHIAAAWLK